MKKITAFSPANLDILRGEIQEALNAIAAKHGIVAGRLGRIGYTADTFKASIDFGTAETSTGEEMIDPKLFMNMKKYGHKVGFAVTDIGKLVDFGVGVVGKAKIVGMCGYTKIAVQNSKGQIYRCDPQSVKRLMAAK